MEKLNTNVQDQVVQQEVEDRKIVIENPILRGLAKTGLFVAECALAAVVGYTVGRVLDRTFNDK